jgi:hypothetical protein
MSVIQRIPRYLARAVSAGAVVVAAALPLAAASAAGAATPATLGVVTFSPGGAGYFGQGASGTVSIAATGLAGNGGTVTVTTTAPGVTFSGMSEGSSTTTATGSFSSTSATVPGFYDITLTDANGAATETNAFYVNAAPTITAMSPASVVAGTTTTVALTGTGFVAGMKVALTSTVDGTMLTPAAGTTATVTSATTATVSVVAKNNVTSGTATAGTYSATVTNADGGTTTTAALFTVTAFGLTSANPSYLPIPASGSTTTTVTITGVNLGTSGILQLGTGGAQNSWLGVPTFTNTSITVPVTVPSTFTPAAALDISYTNSSGQTSVLSGGLGIGTSSTNAGNVPTITSVGSVGTLAYGSAATLTINGTGFAPGMTAAFTSDTTGEAGGITCTVNVISYSQAICPITVGHGALAGSDDLALTTGAGTGTAFANALAVAGPIITSASPAVLGVGQTATVTLTGTGFASTDSLTGTTSATVGSFTYISATSATVVVTTATATTNVQLADSAGTTSTTFSLSAGTAVTVGTTTYSGTTTGVGQGASNVLVTFNGTGFLPGATLTFPAASGVSATVKSVSPTAIVASVSVTAAATVQDNVVTVTNVNGGTGSSSVVAGHGLNVTAGPGTLTASPSASVLAGTKPTLTLTGTSFQAGAVVTSSTSLVTVGTVVVNSATSLTVPLTIVTMNGTSPVGSSLTVTNPDGGVSTLALTITPDPTVTGTYYVPTFSTNLQMIITGTGFQNGMTVSSSNADYTVILGSVTPAVAPSLVSTALLVVSTTSNATAGTSSNIVFTNPDGGTVTFALNGGPKPSTKPAPKATRVVGVAVAGRTVVVKILGVGFYGQPTITSNARGTTARVSGDNGKVLTVRVTVKAGTPRGVHRFTITFMHGEKTAVNYSQR